MTKKNVARRSTPRHPPPKAEKYSAPALEKGLDILELFAREADGMIKSDVARRLNRTHSEVFRMLVCLQRRGYITQGPDERYRLTLRLFELGQHHPPTRRLIREATPIMQDIAHRTSQSCHLAVIEDGIVVILAQAESPLSTGFFVKPGTQVDLMLASSGYVIMAFQGDHAQARSVQQSRQHNSKVPPDLATHLKRIRRKGFEERDSYQVKGVINISFPIKDTHGEAIAALTVPFLPRLDSQATDRLVIDELRRGATRLSAAMGHVDRRTAPTVTAAKSRPTQSKAKTRVAPSPRKLNLYKHDV